MTYFAVISLLQKSMPEQDNVAFLTSLDLWHILSGLALVNAVPFQPSCVSFLILQGGRWFKWGFIVESSRCAWFPLTVTFFEGQFHMTEVPHHLFSLCKLHTFQNPFTFVTTPPWEQLGQTLEPLFCRWGNRLRDFEWLSQGHTAWLIAILKLEPRFLPPNPGTLCCLPHPGALDNWYHS